MLFIPGGGKKRLNLKSIPLDHWLAESGTEKNTHSTQEAYDMDIWPIPWNVLWAVTQISHRPAIICIKTSNIEMHWTPVDGTALSHHVAPGLTLENQVFLGGKTSIIKAFHHWIVLTYLSLLVYYEGHISDGTFKSTISFQSFPKHYFNEVTNRLCSNIVTRFRSTKYGWKTSKP